jgi:hypothetical protein
MVGMTAIYFDCKNLDYRSWVLPTFPETPGETERESYHWLSSVQLVFAKKLRPSENAKLPQI